MENQLIPSEEYRKILEYLKDGILVISGKGVILYCNKALCKIYNVSAYEIIGKDFQYLIDHNIIDHSFVGMVLSTKRKITYSQTVKSGSNIINTSIPVFDNLGQIQYIIEQSKYVTEIEDYDPKYSSDNKHKENIYQPITSYDQKLAEFKSIAMQNIYKLVDNMAPKNINILILGESGTGKSKLASRIHVNSARKGGPFITINCSTIPENLIESELFGYIKGAFSGASQTGKQGLVELSNGGTLFLDEIGELPLSIQAKLLQLVQDKTYLPVGGVNAKQVDTRIIAATNQDIPTLIANGKFREDLYYRLAVVTITMPPLNSRTEDMGLLLNYFANKFNIKHDLDISFSKETIQILCNYNWPGNIRELEHLVEFLILNSQEKYIVPDMLPNNILNYTGCRHSQQIQEKMNELERKDYDLVNKIEESDVQLDFDKLIQEEEGRLIRKYYKIYNTSYKLATKLNISQTKASRLIRKYIIY